MINLDFLIQFQFVIFPEFYAVRDSEDNEYVFLRTGDDKIKSIKSVTDKTQFEAYENHVHLFGKVGKKHQGEAVKVAHFIRAEGLRYIAKSTATVKINRKTS